MDRINNKIKLKSEKGVISIFVVILLPVILLGGLSLFDYLHVYQQENQALKVTYACSDTVLSQYNAFLYDSFALYANHSVADLSTLIAYYFESNRLIGHESDLNIAIKYDALDQIATYGQAVKDASVIQIGNVAADYTLNILDQLEISKKIKKLNDQFGAAEIKLAESFEIDAYKSVLEKIMGGNELNINLDTIREEAVKNFESNMTQLTAQFETLSEANQTLLEPYKLREWQATNQAFIERMDLLEAFEIERDAANREITQLKNDMQQLAVDIQAVEDALDICEEEDICIRLNEEMALLQNRREEHQMQIYALESSVVERAGALYQSLASEMPSIINEMQAFIEEISSLAAGVEIADGQLELDKKYNYEALPNTLEEGNLVDKVLVNEYYLSLFSSYDLACPRTLDPLNRLETKRELKGEIEYILTGKPSEKESVNGVIAQVIALRFPMNLTALLTDAEKMRTIANYTLAIPQPWRTVAYTAILMAWVTAESYLDVMALLKGEGISIIKAASEWHLDLEAFMSKKWTSKTSDQSTYKLYYQDYLRVLLFIQSEETSLKRAMMLMTSEIQEASDGLYDLSHFSRGHQIYLNWKARSIFGPIKAPSMLSLKNNLDGNIGVVP